MKSEQEIKNKIETLKADAKEYAIKMRYHKEFELLSQIEILHWVLTP